jgi:hypothetical protein
MSDPPPAQAATVTRRRMLIVVLMRAKVSAGDVETAIARRALLAIWSRNLAASAL